MKLVVMSQPEMGVYLGSCMGFGFWSKMDSAGQDVACGFKDEEDARRYIASWDHIPEGIEYHEIECARDDQGNCDGCHICYVTVDELKNAGLGDMLGDMEANALMNVEPAGRA